MSICLSHQSALGLLRSPILREPLRRFQAPVAHRQEALTRELAHLDVPTKEGASRLLRDCAPYLSEPLHVLTATRADARTTSLVHTHLVQGGVLRRRLLPVSKDVLVSGPALCFLQMANELDEVKLIELGYELCGTYVSTTEAGEGYYNVRPLTTVSAMRLAISRMKAGSRAPRGARAALSALDYVLDGSASARETHQCMLLCLPPRMGGRGLPFPQLNYRIEVTERANQLSDHSCYFLDAYWPSARVDLEYDSDLAHAEAPGIERDARRRNALEAMGIKVVTMTNRQLADPRLFDQAARAIGKALGFRLRIRACNFAQHERELRRRLGIA